MEEKLMQEKQRVDKKKEKKCKVLFYVNKTLGIDFEGNGISAQVDSFDANKTEVLVEYSGEYGKPDFQFKLK